MTRFPFFDGMLEAGFFPIVVLKSFWKNENEKKTCAMLHMSWTSRWLLFGQFVDYFQEIMNQ
jgi:hypothetical protein